MAVPEAIPVRYTEEEAGYVSFRPLVRQTFRLAELLDMVLSVTGKQPQRVQQILRAGTVVFHSYRYTWKGFEIPDDELAALLARFPDRDASRPFLIEQCSAFLLEEGGTPPDSVEIQRAEAARTGLFRRRSFWDAVAALAAAGGVAYQDYSYARQADLYRMELTAEARASLLAAANRAPRDLRRDLLRELERKAEHGANIVFVCPRAGA